jgi:hypothetical protein
VSSDVLGLAAPEYAKVVIEQGPEYAVTKHENDPGDTGAGATIAVRLRFPGLTAV